MGKAVLGKLPLNCCRQLRHHFAAPPARSLLLLLPVLNPPSSLNPTITSFSTTAPQTSTTRTTATATARTTTTTTQRHRPSHKRFHSLSSSSSATMSGERFSNTDTGDKHPDPYKKAYENDLPVKQKVEDLINFIEGCKFGMMTTRQAQTGLLVSRCMALANRDKGINLMFHTNTESGKTDELHNDPKINIAFINNSGEWASISGEASIVTDRELVRNTYSPGLRAWLGDLGDGKHDGGPDDPRIGVIVVNTITATYALTHRNAVSRGYEMVKGVVKGDIPDVNKVREISKEEIESYKKLAGGS